MATRYSRSNYHEGAGFKLGQRVQLHPATDRWMMGDRYGEVVAFKHVDNDPNQVRVRVKLDRSGKSLWFHPENVMHVNPLTPDTKMLLIGTALVGTAVTIAALLVAKKAAASPSGLPTGQAVALNSSNIGTTEAVNVGDVITITLPGVQPLPSVVSTPPTVVDAQGKTTGVLSAPIRTTGTSGTSDTFTVTAVGTAAVAYVAAGVPSIFTFIAAPAKP